MKILVVLLFALVLFVMPLVAFAQNINTSPVNGWAPNGTYSNITVYNSQMTGDHLQGDSAQKFNVTGIHNGFIEIEKTLPLTVSRLQANHFVIRIKLTELTPVSSLVELKLDFYATKNNDPWTQVGDYFVSRPGLNLWGQGFWVVSQNFPQQFNKLKIKFTTLYPPGGQNINTSVILDWYFISENGVTVYSILDGFEHLLTRIQNQNELTEKFSLSQNHPNPFNPATCIMYHVAKNTLIHLIVYDALGREVKTLVNEELKSGSYKVDWNANNCSSGTYFYRLTAGEFTETKKMVLIR